MNSIRILTVLLSLICIAAAETPLEQLHKKYNKERADGLGALNKRYVQALQAELRHSTGPGSDKTEAEIRVWIADLEAEASAPEIAQALAKAAAKDPRPWFVGATWGTPSADFTFAADGTGTKLYKGKAGVMKWALLDDNTVEAGTGGNMEYFFFHSANKAEFATARNAPRSMLTRRK